MSVSYRFEEIVQRDSVSVKCPECGKVRSLVVRRSYYRNGMHNERETREKNRESIAAEIATLKASGLICQACQDAADGRPILKKIEKGLYAVFLREAPDVEVDRIVAVKHRGWVKWQATITPQPEDSWHRDFYDGRLFGNSLADIALLIKKHHEPEVTP